MTGTKTVGQHSSIDQSLVQANDYCWTYSREMCLIDNHTKKTLFLILNNKILNSIIIQQKYQPADIFETQQITGLHAVNSLWNINN